MTKPTEVMTIAGWSISLAKDTITSSESDIDRKLAAVLRGMCPVVGGGSYEQDHHREMRELAGMLEARAEGRDRMLTARME